LLLAAIRASICPTNRINRPQVDARGAAVVAAAATVANLFESWLGATVQGRVGWLTNDAVNAIQISVAAALAVAAAAALGGS
jgi:uncharacterized membrane protein